MCMHLINIFYIFVPNLGEIYQFRNKIAFAVKNKAHLGPIGTQNTEFRVKNGIVFGVP